MCSLCRRPVAKNHNFGQILISGGLLYRSPFTDEGQIWYAIAHPWYTLTRQISSRSVYSVALFWRKTPIFAIFWTSACSSLRKLNTVAQLQTLPYPTVSKSFLYSNAFVAKSGTQTLTFKRVTDKQTKKLNVFGRTGGG